VAKQAFTLGLGIPAFGAGDPGSNPGGAIFFAMQRRYAPIKKLLKAS